LVVSIELDAMRLALKGHSFGSYTGIDVLKGHGFSRAVTGFWKWGFSP
jgi:hypothetical protein